MQEAGPMVTLTQSRILSSDLFDTPDLVDTLTARMEKDLLLHAWDLGWLPARTSWQFWIEKPMFSSFYLPMAEVRMDVTERRWVDCGCVCHLGSYGDREQCPGGCCG
jgi:hypothetical protein